MRWAIVCALLAGAGALVATDVSASSSAGAARPGKRCKYVVKRVHGHRKRVRVCRPKPKPKPKPKPAPGPETDLAVSIAPSTDRVTDGNQVFYRIEVENKGPLQRADGTLTLAFTGALEYAYPVFPFFDPTCEPASSSEERPREWRCTLQEIPFFPPEEQGKGEASIAVGFVAEAEGSGSVALDAEIEGGERDPNHRNDKARSTVQVLPGPASADVKLAIATAPDQAQVGEDFVETLTVTNDGPTDATAVQVPVLPPAGTRISDLEAPQLFGSLCGAFGGPTSPTLCWDFIPPGGTVTAKVTFVPSRHAPPQLETDALATAYTPDPDLRNNRAHVAVPLAPFNPPPGIDLVVSMTQPASAKVGQFFSVPFRVVNRGADPASDVHLRWMVTPSSGSGGLGIGAESDVNCTSSSVGEWECTVESLDSGSRITGEIDGMRDAAGQVTVTLTASAADSDRNAADNSATVSFDVSP